MSRLQVAKYDLNTLAIVTVIFNPIKYRSRYELYHKFDEHMSKSGVILYTVECIFDCSEALGLPRQKFELTRDNDPRHLQIKAPSVLWLKENLINIAINRLPEYIEYVAWLDADIEFERLDWPHLTLHQLQQFPIVQLFELASFLGPSGKKQILRQDFSFAYAVRHQQKLDPRRSSECYVHPGYGWAMRREMFTAMNGLLDFSILGSGDIHFAYALINRIDETIPPGMNEDYRYLARIWAQRVAQLSGNGSQVSYVPVNIWHHWHGNRVNRGYFERWSILESFQFSPLKDLEKNLQIGSLRLVNPARLDEHGKKRLEDFEKSIISYFRSRNEDNIKRAIATINLKSPTNKTKISTYDVPRPTNISPAQHHRPGFVQPVTTMNDDPRQYLPLDDEIGLYSAPGNDTRSLSLDLQNDSFFNPPPSDYNTRRGYPDFDYPGQLIFYEDEFGNNNLTSPGEISF